MRELRELVENPLPTVQVFASEQDIGFWILVVHVPGHELGTPYGGSCFKATVEFPSTFPHNAPRVRFLTPIRHCNINPYGRVCHSVIGRDWQADTKMRTALSCIYGLLLHPEADDAIDSNLAMQLRTSQDEYKETIRKACAVSRKNDPEKLRVEILSSGDALEARLQQRLQAQRQRRQTAAGAGAAASASASASAGAAAANDEEDGVPAAFRCPITTELMRNPVVASDGQTYERSAIEEWFGSHRTSPMTGARLTNLSLTENHLVRSQIAAFLEST